MCVGGNIKRKSKKVIILKVRIAVTFRGQKGVAIGQRYKGNSGVPCAVLRLGFKTSHTLPVPP